MTQKQKIILEIKTIKNNLMIAHEKKSWSYVLDQSKRLVLLESEIEKLK